MSGKFNWGNKSNFSQNNKREQLSDSVEVVKYPDDEYGAYRFVGEPVLAAYHWFSTMRTPKGSKKPKISHFSKACVGFDPASGEVNAEKCPYCQLDNAPRVEARQNVIDRELQQNEPRNAKPPTSTEKKLREWNGGKHRIKDGPKKGGYTSARVLKVTPAIGNPVAEITSLNKHKNKKTGEKEAYGPNHTRYGFDVMIKYDKNEAPAKMYSVQKGEVTPLTDEEKNILLWDIPVHTSESEATAKKEVAKMKPYLCTREGELLFPEEASGKKSKKSNKFEDEFDAEEDVEEDRKSKKSKSKRRDDDDDDDDGFGDGDDSDDDDDDDGEAPWDEDDDEDERPSKKSKKSKVGKSSKSSSKSSGKVKTKIKTKTGKSKKISLRR